MRTFVLFFLLAFGLAPAAALATPAAPDSAPDCDAIVTFMPKAAETFTVGTLRVERYGDHGRPVILIPGLGSGAWVWADTIKHLRVDHVVYALTLAGFDGIPVPQKMSGLMNQADASLRQLIESRHIDHPVLVGHSLGGTLAIRFAGEHSDLLAGVVAVDGLPIFPMTDKLTDAQRKARARAFGARMAGLTPAQFKAQQLAYMRRVGLLAADAAACYGKLQARSDQAAVAEYAREDFAADYRPLVAHIDVPLLEVSPYNAPDFQALAKRTGRPAITATAKAKYYGMLLGDDAEAQVVTIQPARHFVMLDAPRKFRKVLNAFLAKLPPGGAQ